MTLVRFSKTLWKTWCSFSPTMGRVCWEGNSPVNGSAWWDTTRTRGQGHRGLLSEARQAKGQGRATNIQRAQYTEGKVWGRGEQKKMSYLRVKTAKFTTHVGSPTRPLWRCHSKLCPPNNFGGLDFFFVLFCFLTKIIFLFALLIFSTKDKCLVGRKFLKLSYKRTWFL